MMCLSYYFANVKMKKMQISEKDIAMSYSNNKLSNVCPLYICIFVSFLEFIAEYQYGESDDIDWRRLYWNTTHIESLQAKSRVRSSKQKSSVSLSYRYIRSSTELYPFVSLTKTISIIVKRIPLADRANWMQIDKMHPCEEQIHTISIWEAAQWWILPWRNNRNGSTTKKVEGKKSVFSR